MTKYAPTGPFSPIGPGISSTFLNNVETFLGYAADTNITTDGSGNQTMRSITLHAGSLYEIGFFGGVSTVSSIAHGCTGKPDFIVIAYRPAGDTTFGGEPTVIPHAENIGTTTTGVRAQTGYNWTGIAIRHL